MSPALACGRMLSSASIREYAPLPDLSLSFCLQVNERSPCRYLRYRFLPEIPGNQRLVRMRPRARRSAGTVATHKHPIQAAVLAVIVIEAGFMQ
jgi:hypothetical protein